MTLSELNEECSLFRPEVRVRRAKGKLFLVYFNEEWEEVVRIDSRQSSVKGLTFHEWARMIDGFAWTVQALTKVGDRT
ncbi:hypothetical protein EVC24_137 [Rhizobium phage RHph_I4]|nr:hypothetical protein EVC24_137 [Rhizobium phage RHph_I4]